jgi:hypothetical protein
MSNSHDADFDSPARIAQEQAHVESAELPSQTSMPVQTAPESAVLLPDSSASRIRGRGNTPMRTAMLQRMQQTYGNRALQRFLSAQRSASPAAAVEEEDVAGRIGARAGKGSAIDDSTRGRLEGGLGADLSGVRVHTDGEADHLARSVDATAFTTGNDIFFRQGAYDPGSEPGMHLLAHEATHAVQQSQGPVAGTPSAGGVSISDPSDRFEQAAERAAHNVVSGQPADVGAVAGGGAAQVQREAAPEEEEEEMPSAQTMRSSTYAAFAQREAAPEEEEEEPAAQRMPYGAPVQRHGSEEDDHSH